jgi:hypothetical protein
MDLVVLILITIIIMLILRRLDSFVFFLVGLDILLNLFTIIKDQITVEAIYNFLDEYIPTSFIDIIDKYSNGLFHGILIWLYIFVVVLFEYYLLKMIIKKSRRS